MASGNGAGRGLGQGFVAQEYAGVVGAVRADLHQHHIARPQRFIGPQGRKPASA